MSRVGNFLGKLFSAQPSNGNHAILRAYGKLPMYAEYRRLELSPGTPTAFSQWIDSGRLAWVKVAGRRGAAPGCMLPSRMLVRLPDTREAVVASIWDSRDSLGRVFPFAFFIVCPAEALGVNALERFAAAVTIFDAFDRTHAELARLAAGGDFYKLYAKRHIPLKPDNLDQRTQALADQVAGIDAAAWFDASGLAPLTPQAWFAGLLQRSGRWRNEPAALADSALACPLARAIPADIQAALWLRWLTPFIEKTGKTPWFIAPGRGDAAGREFTIVLREFMPDDFQLLTSFSRDYDFVEHLDRVPATASEAPEPDSSPTGGMLEWLSAHASAAK